MAPGGVLEPESEAQSRARLAASDDPQAGRWCSDNHGLEHGIVYAQLHFHPIARPAGSTISPPSVSGGASEQIPEPSVVPTVSPEVVGTRDYRRRLRFNFRIIADAQDHYEELGYEDIAVPWVISREAMDSTLPAGKDPYATFGGYLVGSAEQSFIDMLLSGDELGRVQATTPCFRDEAHDELHSPYFLKTELFDSILPPTVEGVLSVLEDAFLFLSRYREVRIEQQGELSWDIVDAETGVELGSYGVRRIPGHSWIYGTGVALPRLQQTIDGLTGV